MADRIILLDSSILIDYFRKKHKAGSLFYKLAGEQYRFAVSVITLYEVYAGANEAQLIFWKTVFDRFVILPLDERTVLCALQINIRLKRDRKQIALPDLFIAATAINNRLKIATFNTRHFSRITNLDILEVKA